MSTHQIFAQKLRDAERITPADLVEETLSLPCFLDLSKENISDKQNKLELPTVSLPYLFALIDRCTFSAVDDFVKLAEVFRAAAKSMKRAFDIQNSYLLSRIADYLECNGAMASNRSPVDTRTLDELKREFFTNDMRTIIDDIVAEKRGDKRECVDQIAKASNFLLSQGHRPENARIVAIFFELVSPIEPDSNRAFYTHLRLLTDTIDSIAERTEIQFSESEEYAAMRTSVGDLILTAWRWLEFRHEQELNRSNRSPDPRWLESVSKLQSSIQKLEEVYSLTDELSGMLACPKWNEATQLIKA